MHESMVLAFTHVIAGLGITRYFACSKCNNLRNKRVQNNERYFKTDRE